MIIRELHAEEYRQAFPRPAIAYNSVEFNDLNAPKVERVVRAAAVNNGGAPVAGLTFGVNEGRMRAPFSAPFACLDFNRELRAEPLLEVAHELRRAYAGLQITLPPPVYCPGMTDKTLLALLTAGATPLYSDWNYHIDLQGDYMARFYATARNKLRQAERTGFRLEECEALRAYEVIRINRESKGYPLRMTAAQVLATVKPTGPVKAHFFVLTDGVADAAAAVVFDVAPGIAQVIYWGDVPEPPCRHAMNLLAARLSDHYAARGYHTLDIGPSGTEGIPSIGLSDFKDSIGCICSPRPTLRL